MTRFPLYLTVFSLALALLAGPAAAQNAQAYIEKGMENSQKGNYDEAIKNFDQALQAKPNDAAILTYRGVVYYAKKQNDRALQDFAQAIKADPKFGRAYYQQGMVLETMNRHDEALKALQQAKNLGYRVDEDFFEMVKGKAAEHR